MAFQLETWINGETKLNASKMNSFQNNIKTQFDVVDENLQTLQSQIDAIPTEVPDGIPIGSGMDYFGSTAPENYMFADGSAISRTVYSALFAIIGTTYGAGDGSTTFNLPDKRERLSIPKGTSTAFNTLGKTGGSFSHTLTKEELPNTPITGPFDSFSVTRDAEGFALCRKYGPDTETLMNSLGSGQAIDITPKHLVCNYIIKVK